MKKGKFSLYLALAVIIFTIVTVIMTINSIYSYSKIKERAIEHIKNSSKTTILSIKDNVQSLIASYSVNEYDNLIQNEITRRDIFAILINDYNMGEITGNGSFITGKIKHSNNQIVDYNPKDELQNKKLSSTFFTDTYDIVSTEGRKIGTISIYISNKNLKDELNTLIIENIKNTIFLSIILIITLFIAIRIFILKPIYLMTKTLNKSDKEGFPINLISNNPLIELSELSVSINKMINTIKESTTSIKKNQYRLEYLLEQSPIAVRIAKNKGEDVVFANIAYSKLLRENINETIHKNPKEFYADKNEYEEIINALEKNEAIHNKLVKLNIKGEIVWALASYMNVDFDGESSIIGWFYDVTNEKNNEAKLYNALELQTRIFDNTGYLIIRTDENGIIKQINKEVTRVLGYTAEELIDKHTPVIIHNKEELIEKNKEFSKELNMDIKVGFQTFVAKSIKGMNNEHEWTYISKNGNHIPVMLSVTALRDKNNKIYGFLGISRDLTETKLVESQAKLASMGEMIGNIAHQWRQPLSVISTISSGMKLKMEFNDVEEKELMESMDNITLQAKYLSKTIDDFRDFIKNTNDKEKFLISNLIQKTISILSSSFVNNNIKIISNVKDDKEILGFKNQLIQALINIINNSKDALSSMGEDKEKLIFIETKAIDEKIVLSIKDNAGGIDNEVIDKIFEPYFTTKHKSIGTGIGLSMTYQILHNHHNATIKASNIEYIYDDKKHLGACFEITF